jgi:hypothetical protein
VSSVSLGPSTHTCSSSSSSTAQSRQRTRRDTGKHGVTSGVGGLAQLTAGTHSSPRQPLKVLRMITCQRL